MFTVPHLNFFSDLHFLFLHDDPLSFPLKNGSKVCSAKIIIIYLFGGDRKLLVWVLTICHYLHGERVLDKPLFTALKAFGQPTDFSTLGLKPRRGEDLLACIRLSIDCFKSDYSTANGKWSKCSFGS